MCWEQSRRKRTIAASRSVATTTETNPETETTRRRQDSARPTDLKDSRSRPALPLWTNPEENRSPLDKLFQEWTNPEENRSPLDKLFQERSDDVLQRRLDE